MSAAEPCRYLTWDSEFFRRRIARVNGTRMSLDQMQAALAWCKQHRIDCLYFLAGSDDRETVRCAEEHSFHMVDIRLTLERDLKGYNPSLAEAPGSLHIRPATPADLPVLKEIAAISYCDSRFYYDACFSRTACQALYTTWIEKSFQDASGVVLVAEADSHVPVGYTTCERMEGEQRGQIGLVGIAAGYQGQGAGRMLVESALDWFVGNDFQTVNVVTQGRNIPAQRLYQRCGFRTRTVQIWYHRWFSNCSAEEGN